jgi:hypothetical protein
VSISQHEINEKVDDIGEILADLRFKLKHKLEDGDYYSSRKSDETLLNKIEIMFQIIEL